MTPFQSKQAKVKSSSILHLAPSNNATLYRLCPTKCCFFSAHLFCPDSQTSLVYVDKTSEAPTAFVYCS